MENKKSNLENHGQTNILIYGVPKVGLTTLAAKFPQPLFLNISDDVSRLDVPAVKIDSWPHFLKVAKDVSLDSSKFKTLVVSHIEGLWQILCDHITKESNGKNGTAAHNISELSFAEWRQALQLFEEKLIKLTRSQSFCRICSHQQR